MGMEFHYQITNAAIILSPEEGFQMHCTCKIKEPKGLSLKSEKRWDEALHSVDIYPVSTGPYQETFEYARVGEFCPALLSQAGHPAYTSWLQIPTDQFNAIYTELSKGNKSISLSLCFNEDESPATESGVYDDTKEWGVDSIPLMTYRAFFNLLSDVKQDEKSRQIIPQATALM